MKTVRQILDLDKRIGVFFCNFTCAAMSCHVEETEFPPPMPALQPRWHGFDREPRQEQYDLTGSPTSPANQTEVPDSEDEKTIDERTIVPTRCVIQEADTGKDENNENELKVFSPKVEHGTPPSPKTEEVKTEEDMEVEEEAPATKEEMKEDTEVGEASHGLVMANPTSDDEAPSPTPPAPAPRNESVVAPTPAAPAPAPSEPAAPSAAEKLKILKAKKNKREKKRQKKRQAEAKQALRQLRATAP